MRECRVCDGDNAGRVHFDPCTTTRELEPGVSTSTLAADCRSTCAGLIPPARDPDATTLPDEGRARRKKC
jgi:hypothetical protein